MKLHWKIIIGMFAGVVFGLLMSQTSFGSDIIKDWIKPFGTIFIEYGSPIFFEKNMDFNQCKQDFIKGMNNIEHSNLEYANKQNI